MIPCQNMYSYSINVVMAALNMQTAVTTGNGRQ